MNIVYKDFSVRSTAVEATAVWSQGQAFHATIVSGLHFKRYNCYICNRCFVKDEPQADEENSIVLMAFELPKNSLQWNDEVKSDSLR